jgi:signal transduction histidine kinase
VTRRVQAYAVAVGVAPIGSWLVIDAVRQNEIGQADAGLWFVVCAAPVALCAAVAIGRWEERMALLILAWLLVAVADDAGVDWAGSRVAATVAVLAIALQGPAYAHMALAYPSGRVRHRSEVALLPVFYAIGLLWMAFPALFADPSRCRSCSPHAPTLFFTGTTFDLNPIGTTFSAVFIALGVLFLALIARRLRETPIGARRTLLPLAAAGLFACAHFVVQRVAWLAHWTAPQGTLDWLGRADLLILPAAIFLGIATIRRHRGPLGDLVVELAEAPPGEVQGALRRAVGDPSLELALWLPQRGEYVTEDGAPVALDQQAPGRAITRIGTAEQPLAAIVHDASLAGQGPLLQAAGSAAHLALENARLQAELRGQLQELRASRARIVAAGDAERRRLERDLHDGAQQRLLALGLALQLLDDERGDPQLLCEARQELQAALRELRELARGIHPAILSDRGLPAAVASLLDRVPLTVTADISDERYPQPVESAAYFVISEALANIAKHAQARSATLSIGSQNGTLLITVHDDGKGGAQPTAGSGLQGLVDRVGALDGQLQIHSPPGAGTTIQAEIPCASS